jgi:protein-L-isoaspartate(D-aspartate) O-methyltransferase
LQLPGGAGRGNLTRNKSSGEAVPDRSAELRRRYAAEITRLARVRDPRIEEAFAAVPREDFAGPPPWRVSGGWFGGKGENDLASLYDDVLVAIDAGYYTAILARLVGPSGRVIAYEIEPDVAERARVNLAGYPQVEVRARSGVGEALPAADCIYVSAAASHPVRAWLDALKVGGRLLFPLQAAHSTGAMLLVTRPASGDAWPARFLTGVVFIACEGAQDAGMGRKLDEAFRRGGSDQVRSLRFGASPSRSDWLRGDGWALSTYPAW